MRRKLCHPDRSVAIGFINRNAKWRDLLVDRLAMTIT